MGIAAYRYPHGVYQNENRALSCIFRIGIEVFEIFEVPVEIADPVRLRLALGNA
jgi:hypothetical protein